MHRLRLFSVAQVSAGVVLGTGVELNPVILGQPAVDAAATALALPPLVVSGSVSWTVEWFVGEQWTANAAGTSLGTGTTMAFTNAHIMRQVWIKCSATVNSVPVEYYSARQWVHPATGMTADNAGCPTWVAHTSDPDGAAAYSASTLYKTGDVVTHSGNNWFCQDMYSFGIAPGTDATKWTQIVTTLYLDTSAGSNGTGTKVSPFNDPYEFQIRTSSWMTGGTKAATGTLFLFARGTTVNIQMHMMNNVSARRWMFGCYGASGARPVLVPALSAAYLSALSIFTPPSATMSVGRYFLSGLRVVDLEFDGKNRYILNVITTNVTGTIGTGAATFGGFNGTIISVGTHNTTSTYFVFEMTSRDEYVSAASGALVTGTGSATVTSTLMQGINSISGPLGTGSNDGAQNLGMRGCKASNYTSFGLVWRGAPVGGYLPDLWAHECEVQHSCISQAQGAGGLIWEHTRNSRYFFNTLNDCGHLSTLENHQMYGTDGIDSCVLFCKASNSRAGGKIYGNTALVYHGPADNLDIAWCLSDQCKSGFAFNDGYDPSFPEPMYDVRFIGNKVRGATGANGVSWDITSVVRMTMVNNITEDSNPGHVYGWRAVGGGTPGSHGDTTLTDAILAGNTFVRASLFFGDYSLIKGDYVVNLRSHNNACFDRSTGDASWLSVMWSNTIPTAEIDGSTHNAAYRADAGNVARYGTLASGTSYLSLVALNAAQAFLESTSVGSNPLLTNTTAGTVNVIPQVGSPLLAAGVDMRRRTGIGCDYAGNQRPAVPAIGAMERV